MKEEGQKDENVVTEASSDLSGSSINQIKLCLSGKMGTDTSSRLLLLRPSSTSFAVEEAHNG